MARPKGKRRGTKKSAKQRKPVLKSIKIKPLKPVKERPPSPETAGKRVYTPYSNVDLQAAYNAVKDDGYKVGEAARVFGVPRSTLFDKVSGRSPVSGVRKGPPPLLSTEDEQKIVDYLLQMSQLGYTYSVSELRVLASELAIEKGKLDKHCQLSAKWHKGFRQRWPILNEKLFGPMKTHDTAGRKRKPRAVVMESIEDELHRIKTTSLPDDVHMGVSNYFTELHMLMIRYGLLDKPNRIFCIDEVTIQYESGFPKAKPVRNLKNPILSRTENSVISVVGCGNAIGNALPPYLIFPGEEMCDDYLLGKLPGTSGDTTWNGNTDYQTMKRYLQTHFLEYALMGIDRNPPVMLLYDANKVKFSPDTIEWAKLNNIILFVLPPNTTHLTQPLEKGCFKEFRDVLFREARLFKEINGVDCIQKTDICGIVSEAYPLAFSTRNLVNSFEETGIYPYKPSVVLSDEMRTQKLKQKQLHHALHRRPVGMTSKAVQVNQDDIKSASKKKFMYMSTYNKGRTKQESSAKDPTITFLRDKKIQRMLGDRVVDEEDDTQTDLSESEEEEELIEEEPVEPGSETTYYIVQGGAGAPTSQSALSQAGHEYYMQAGHDYGLQNHTKGEPEYIVEAGDVGALETIETVTDTPEGVAVSQLASHLLGRTDPSTYVPKSEVDLNSLENTRVAVQALQDIANDVQVMPTTSVQSPSTIQNIELNSGRMIQVVIQNTNQANGHRDSTIEQVEIDNSISSIM